MLKGEHTATENSLSKYLSPMAAWALAFGCAVGWGSFVMPGTTFLPIAGPLGSVLGLMIGAAVMLIIGMNYRTLMAHYPDAGGAYTYAGKILGGDHGFLCAWMLILTYWAIIWANCTALSLIFRYLFGNTFCFGFSYQIAGYTVYFGEVLLAIALIVITCAICMLSKRLSVWVQIIFAVLMLVCVCVAFTAVVVHHGGFSGLTPAFAKQGSPVVQVLGIVILAPWAYIGFESISHSTSEFKFSVKKTLPIMVAALVAGALCYSMLVVCAGLAVPDGFSSWGEYIASLGSLDGIRGLPTFYAAREAMGGIGLTVLGLAALGGVITGLIGNFIALSRLVYKMSSDGMLPKKLGTLNKKGIPYVALIVAAAVSCLIPFFGRTAVSWIVDVTTIGAAIVYTYASISAYIIGRREKRTSVMLWGGAGAVISLLFVIFYLLPALWKQSRFAPQSYLILIVWSILGMLVFRVLMQRDQTRRFGKSEIVWIILSFLVLIVSTIWIQESTAAQATVVVDDIRTAYTDQAVSLGLDPDGDLMRGTGSYITRRINDFGESMHTSIYVQGGLIVSSLAIIFSIFSIIKKREQKLEAERLLAEETSRAKSNFLSNMSHDLRTPMNAVIGYTALALREDDISDKVQDYLEKIEHSGNNLLALINDILDLSRIESGKMEQNLEPTDLHAMMEGIRTIFAVQMEEKPLEFVLDFDRVSDRYVICDKNRLCRVLENLISNAYKFTPEGGKVEVILHQTNEEEDFGDYVLTVEDNGIGMSPEFAKTVFNAFERERNSTVNQIQGTGLGMSITKSLIEMMGGTIEVDSEQGKGTKFTVKLRLFAANEKEIKIIEESRSHTEKKQDFSDKRLLLVEDNPINREIACAILGMEGFTVDTAENGKIAVDMIAMCRADTYDVVLMDIQMPVMNGYEASRAIRAMKGKRSQLPIVALTANTFEEDRQNVIDAGMNTHVLKPFTPDELISTISELIKE